MRISEAPPPTDLQSPKLPSSARSMRAWIRKKPPCHSGCETSHRKCSWSVSFSWLQRILWDTKNQVNLSNSNSLGARDAAGGWLAYLLTVSVFKGLRQGIRISV